MSRPPLREAKRLLLFARVLAFVPVVYALVRLPLPILTRLLERVVVSNPPKWPTERDVESCVESAFRVVSPVLRRSCLIRTVTLFVFLRRAGIEVDIAFGMGTPTEDLSGHCWLIRDGKPFMEKRDPRSTFVELYRIPRASGSLAS